ncbi:LysR family transcriptional regulator [Planomonospora venezuelensis]|uniref:DNA-binding transcriptional LysR family regulator n=1 Tax=Planomonospora venezuelensis TaxID=1999 RepID=A0A841DKL8_PLAVE|nr:LysR family transcriptional regulator [Planomonospora venezuelensis]MBB5967656.1 DNA-binding transcriptional LysR family regulator [Planomonospora venezuelensis]GIN03563.1 LysR family transcriptional regulator [Planomonospora venezuelensis]
MDVHLRELRYFVAVAGELNVTRAAQRLFVSQPALSKQLRALEGRLGFPLFDRVHSGVTLTRQGRALLPFARELLERWDEGVGAARAAAPSGTLVVGMQTAVGRGIQQEALRRFREAMPGWEVSLRLVNWTDPSGGLADGSSDVAFVWLPAAPGLETRVLSVERRVIALPDSHPLAARAEIPFAELRDEPFIALPAAAGPLRDFWLARDAREDDPVVAVTASTADETFEAITSGLGVALLAEGNASLYKRPGMVYRPVGGLAPAELAVAWRKGDRRPHVRVFLDALPRPSRAQASPGAP